MRKKRNRAKRGAAARLGIGVGVAAVVAAGATAASVWQSGAASGAQPVAETRPPAAITAKAAPSTAEAMIRIVSEPKATVLAKVTGAVALSDEAKRFFAAIDGTAFPAGRLFDYAAWANGNGQPAPDADSYSYLASLLYEAAVKAGFEPGERHLHQRLPVYASPGFDAFAGPEGNNLSLLNPYGFGAKARLVYDGDLPTLMLTGAADAGWKPVEVAVALTRYPPERAEIADPKLAPGDSSVRSAGEPGLLAAVTADGLPISRDFYLPSPAIVAVGPGTPSQPAAVTPAAPDAAIEGENGPANEAQAGAPTAPTAPAAANDVAAASGNAVGEGGGGT